MDGLLGDEDLLLREGNVERLARARKLLTTNLKAGLTALENVANEGSVLAMLYLGHAYYSGLKDHAVAEKWYRAAYEHNSSRGLYDLGALYYAQGKYRDAEEIFLDGVSRGDAAAMYGLARLYLRDDTNRGQIARARELLEKSVAAGQMRARVRLAMLLISGRYGPWNMVRGLWLYLSAIPKAFWIAWRHPHSESLW